MTSRYFINFLLISLTILAFSCDQEIDLTLDGPPQKLVVEGRIAYNADKPVAEQTITLSVLGEFFENNETPRATGAVVSVMDGNGQVFNYSEKAPGVYSNSLLKGEPGQTYTLSIDWDGQKFEAIETLVNVVPIDTIYQVFEEENLFEDGGIKIAIDFLDQSGTENFYLWETYLEGELQILPDPGNKNNLIGSDDFFDGQQIVGYFPNEELVFDPGDQVSVQQIGLSRNAYSYYFTLYDQLGRLGAALDTPPVPIRGNIRNLTNPDNFPLGYFLVSEFDEKTHVIIQTNE